jgi:hypothetical protein
MADRSPPATLMIAAAILLSCTSSICAQDPQTAPRTPMSPGSDYKILMAPTDRDRAIWRLPSGLAPGPMAPAMPPHAQPPDLLSSDTEAIGYLAEGKADVVVSSQAATELILQLYRPDQNQWQDYRLAPLANTLITCPPCAGKLKFSFNDGTQQTDIDVEAPSVLRIFRDSSGSRWRWDSFKLEAAAKSQ